ncbi:MAG: hypothetical protein FGM14_14045 [Flavobacteriales bacterium]|nr:hypothetical protein [Flavobacteriales bacterium]
MSLNITSRKFFDDQAREVTNLLGNANNYIKAVYRIAIEYKVTLSASVSVIIEGTVLTLTNGTWEDYGFVPGSTNLDVINVNGHTTTRSITLIDGAQMLIDTNFSTSIPDGTYSVGSFICDTKTEGLNVFFNFCKNSLSNGSSLIDSESNRWTVDGIGTMSISDVKNLVRLGNQSGLAKVISATVKYISASPLIYELTIETFITPFHNNDAYFGAESLASWLKVEALPIYNNPNIKLERTDKYNGNVGYFNENFNGGLSAFTKVSIAWTDLLTNSIDQLDYTQPCLFTARIDGIFSASNKFQFYAFFPSSELSDFSNLPTNASKNFISTTETSAKSVATNYTLSTETHSSGALVQFQNVRFEQHTTYVIITGRANPNADFTTLIESRDETNRNYRIWVRCETPTLDFNSSDMVNVEIDNATMKKNTLPLGTFNSTDILIDHAGNEIELIDEVHEIITEDDVRFESAFLLERNNAEFTEINVSIVAQNVTTNESFELERFALNLNSLPFLPNGTKPINSIINRGFNISSDSLMTQVRFERNPTTDVFTHYGVKVKYPFLSRWEYWLQQLNASNDFFGSKNRNWEQYQNSDWRVEQRLGLVRGDGEYLNTKILDIRDYDDRGINYTVEFFLLDGTPITAPINEIIKIKVTHDVSGIVDCWGTITVEPKENAPRWLISTEYDQLDPDYPLQPLSGETALKKTINSGNVEFEALFDGRFFNDVSFTSRLQVVGGCTNEFARITYTYDGETYTRELPRVGVVNGESYYRLFNDSAYKYELSYQAGDGNWLYDDYEFDIRFITVDFVNWDVLYSPSNVINISSIFVQLPNECIIVNLDGVEYELQKDGVREERNSYYYYNEGAFIFIDFQIDKWILSTATSTYHLLSTPDIPISDAWVYVSGGKLESVETQACECPSESHRIKETYKIAKKPKITTPENRGFNDCGCIPFLTLFDATDTARHKNDVNSAWGIGESVSFELKKGGIATNYTPTAVQFPNQTDAFYSTIEWRDVYFLDGIGCYELYITYNYAGISETKLWGKYQLAPYTLANGSVRLLSYFNDVNSSIGIDFTGAFVKDTLRLKGKFGFWNPLTEVDNIQYTDAERMKVKREDVTEYELRVDLHTECYIDRLRFHLLSENACYISDHNADNYTYSYLDFPVIVKEGFTPEWIEGTRKVKGVAKFQDKQKLTRTYFQDNNNTGTFSAPQNTFVPAIITDDGETIQVGSGQTYTCSGGTCDDATVKNSNASYSDTVISGGTLTLPDTTVNIYVDGVLSATETLVTLDPTEEINITA